jgi:hypothetical protein
VRAAGAQRSAARLTPCLASPPSAPPPKGSAVFSVAKVDPSTGEVAGVFESVQPSDTDLGAKAPKDVKITGLWCVGHVQGPRGAEEGWLTETRLGPPSAEGFCPARAVPGPGGGQSCGGPGLCGGRGRG